MRACMHILKETHEYMHAYIEGDARMRACIYKRRHMHACMHILKETHACMDAYTKGDTRMLACI